MSSIVDDEFVDFEPLDLTNTFDALNADDFSNIVKTVSPTPGSSNDSDCDVQSSPSWLRTKSDCSTCNTQNLPHDQTDAPNQNQSSMPFAQVPKFVNAYLIVDPATQQVVMPEQTLTCNVNGQMLSAVCGPKILEFTEDQIQRMSKNAVPLPLSRCQKAPSGSLLAKPSSEPSTSIEVPQLPSFSDLLRGYKETKKAIKPRGKVSAAFLASKLTSSEIAPKPLTSDAPQKVVASSCCRSKTSSYDSSCSGDLLPPPPQLPVLKALTAYNFFFRDERDALVQGRESEGFDWSLQKRHVLLSNHWYRDRNMKRRHRKTEGNIGFSTLSKIISKRWKMLPKAGKEFYRDVASRDLERFQNETNHFHLSENTETN